MGSSLPAKALRPLAGFQKEEGEPVRSLTIESRHHRSPASVACNRLSSIGLTRRGIAPSRSTRDFQNCHILSHSAPSAYWQKRLIPLILAALGHHGARKEEVSHRAEITRFCHFNVTFDTVFGFSVRVLSHFCHIDREAALGTAAILRTFCRKKYRLPMRRNRFLSTSRGTGARRL